MGNSDIEHDFEWSRSIPNSARSAATKLAPWVNLDVEKLEAASDDELLGAWFAIAYLYPGLHPDDGHTRDPSYVVYAVPEGLPVSLALCYEQSGWPVSLVALLDEMRRRYDHGAISENLFYCSDVAMAGIDAKRKTILERH